MPAIKYIIKLSSHIYIIKVKKNTILFRRLNTYYHINKCVGTIIRMCSRDANGQNVSFMKKIYINNYYSYTMKA